MDNNYILPFLWMKGESREVIAEEIAKIDACGIKAICLESRPHPDFMGKQWWSDMEFIIAEAKKRQMKLWILDDAHFPTGYANGLIKDKYPERRKRYLLYNVANVWGKSGKVSVNVKQMCKPLVSFMDLDKPIDREEQAQNKLVAVVAYPLRNGNQIDEDGGIDLMDQVQGDTLTCSLPKDNYRVFVIFETATDGGAPDYINMMDKVSCSTQIEAVYEPHYEHFGEEFGKTIAGFFSDEPPIGNIPGFSSDTQIGAEMPLPWSEELCRRFSGKYGKEWAVKLPYLWTESVQMEECAQVRHSFMDLVTQLYEENFSRQLGDWCSAHHVEYIGHIVEDGGLHQRLGSGIGHYFRAMAGQHMAGIDVISDQVTIGDEGYETGGIMNREGSFFHYGLAKMGASAGHLDPQKQGRTMCELFGASGWQTGVRNMKFILDHLLVRGVNYLVPHAFSMAEYPDPDCPPHFYARGNNPQFRYFAELMKYANRMCGLLNGGVHAASVAVLYPAEAEWGGKAMTLEHPAKVLQQAQIEFDFVSADMLEEASVTDAGFQIHRQTFRYLILPASEGITAKAFAFLRSNPGMKVICIDRMPEKVLGAAARTEAVAMGQELSAVLEKAAVVPLAKLGTYLRKQGAEDVELVSVRKGEEESRSGSESKFADLVYYHYQKEQDIYLFHNESAYESFRGEIALPLKRGAVYYDGLKDAYYALPVRQEGGKSIIAIELPPCHLGVILDQEPAGLPPYRMLSEELEACTQRRVLDGSWRYALATEKEYPHFTDYEQIEALAPVSDIMPEFSGHILYEKEFELAEKPEKAYLEFTEAYECVDLSVNNVHIGDILNPPYIFEISGALENGMNHIRAVVTTTLDRDQMNYPEPFIVLDFHVSEPTGLAGEAVLHLKI